MFVVFGASGNVGYATAVRLRQAGRAVRAVVRREQQGTQLASLGCEIAIADLADRTSVAEAIEGAHAVQILCPVPRADSHLANTMRHMIDTAADVLRTNPPPRILALSDYGAEQDRGTGITLLFHELEAQLRSVPSHLTFLRAAEHMHNWGRVIPAALTAGLLPSLHHPLEKRFPTVAAQDVGRLAADLLIDDDPDGDISPRIVSIEGPARVSALDVARTLSALSGRTVAAQALPREAWTPMLLRAGLSLNHAQLTTDLYDAHNNGRIDVEDGVGERRFGTTLLADVLASMLPRVEAAAR
ncbi:NAD(P)H dehydrogenase (quinone) [Paraburkholderia sp. GAS41]|uniref:NmrA family NAD(P)-binding protein n=1 Tax=Paraburkholderia sp. GAS41 TaxID=3035134 RepID=UPI003D22BD9C